jgi:hypothetical protein
VGRLKHAGGEGFRWVRLVTMRRSACRFFVLTTGAFPTVPPSTRRLEPYMLSERAYLLEFGHFRRVGELAGFFREHRDQDSLNFPRPPAHGVAKLKCFPTETSLP